MKKILCLSAFLFALTYAHAQAPKLAWSQVIETGKNVPSGQIFGNPKDGYFIPRNKSNVFLLDRTLILDKFDAQLKFKFTKELDIPAPESMKGEKSVK